MRFKNTVHEDWKNNLDKYTRTPKENRREWAPPVRESQDIYQPMSNRRNDPYPLVARDARDRDARDLKSPFQMNYQNIVNSYPLSNQPAPNVYGKMKDYYGPPDVQSAGVSNKNPDFKAGIKVLNPPGKICERRIINRW